MAKLHKSQIDLVASFHCYRNDRNRSVLLLCNLCVQCILTSSWTGFVLKFVQNNRRLDASRLIWSELRAASQAIEQRLSRVETSIFRPGCTDRVTIVVYL